MTLVAKTWGWRATALASSLLLGLACDSATAPSEVIVGRATVESVSVRILESFPVQVSVQARGYLGDGCTTMGEITQARDGNTFRVTIPTRRPKDQICTQQLVGFDTSVPLSGVVGLPAGTYVVDVNGTRGQFELAVDNIIR